MGIKSTEGKVLGTTLDPLAALINHSCDPNVFVFSEGRQLRIRALKAISMGEELTQCYADVVSDVLFRQEILESIYFFACKCRFPLFVLPTY